MGSVFEMSSDLLLDMAQTRLAWAGIEARRTRTRPVTGVGPFLAIRHSDVRLQQVCRIIGDIDHFAQKR